MEIVINPLSLHDLAKTKILQCLWTSKEIVEDLDKAIAMQNNNHVPCNSCAGCSAELANIGMLPKLSASKMKVESNATKLPLTKKYNAVIAEDLKEVGFFFVCWIIDNTVGERNYWLADNFVRKLALRNLRWTAYGRVDNIQSEQFLLGDKDLDDINKYMLACRLGREDQIFALWGTVNANLEETKIPIEDRLIVELWSDYAKLRQSEENADLLERARQNVYGQAFLKSLSIGDNDTTLCNWTKLLKQQQLKFLNRLVGSQAIVRVKSFWAFAFLSSKLEKFQQDKFGRRFFDEWARSNYKGSENYLLALAAKHLTPVITYKSFMSLLFHFVQNSQELQIFDSQLSNLIALWKASSVQYRKRFVHRHINTTFSCCGSECCFSEVLNLHGEKIEEITGDIIEYMKADPNFELIEEGPVDKS